MSSLMRISVSSIFWDPRNSSTNKRCFRFHCTGRTFLHSLLSRPSREAASYHLLLGPSFVYCFCFIYVNIYLLSVNVIKSQHNVENYSINNSEMLNGHLVVLFKKQSFIVKIMIARVSQTCVSTLILMQDTRAHTEWIQALGNVLGCSKPQDTDWWQMVFEIEYKPLFLLNDSLDFNLTWKCST